MADWIETNVSHGAGIDVIAGQQVVVFVGTEQALRRTDDGFGEAILVLHVHDLGSLRAWECVPSWCGDYRADVSCRMCISSHYRTGQDRYVSGFRPKLWV